MKISVLGCGRWGSCIAWYLDRIGNEVVSCGLKEAPELQQLMKTHKNDYLTFPDWVLKRFEAGVREIAQKHNRLQIAVPSQIATIILPMLLGEFHQLHPEIELEITEPAGSAALDMVEREEVDLAFVHDAEGRPNLALRKLSEWPICLCVRKSHPLAAASSVTLAETAKFPLVLLSRNFILTRQVLAHFDRKKLQPRVLHYSPNLSTVWNTVQQGIALSILTGNAILPDSGLIAVPIAGLSQKGFIVTKKGRQIYADGRCLIDFIKHKFTGLQQ